MIEVEERKKNWKSDFLVLPFRVYFILAGYPSNLFVTSFCKFQLKIILFYKSQGVKTKKNANVFHEGISYDSLRNRMKSKMDHNKSTMLYRLESIR